MTLALIVALALGGLGVYVAYQNPKLGGALLVGLAIVTALYVVWEKDPTLFEMDSPPQVTPRSPVPVPAAPSPVPPAASATPPGSTLPPTV